MEPIWTPPHLTPAQLEARRLAAAAFFPQVAAARCFQSDVARRFGVSRKTVAEWYRAWRRDGEAGLARRPHTGRPSKLSARAWDRLARQLDLGAVVNGYPTERWTLARVADLTQRRLGVRYHPRSLGRVLRAHGWSPQRPTTKAVERNEEVIAAWLRRDWPRIKRGLSEAGTALPSWTKRVSRIGPASVPRGRRGDGPRSSGDAPNGGKSRALSR
jgi:transposase